MISWTWKHPQHGRARHTQFINSLRHISSTIDYSPWKIHKSDQGFEPTTLEFKIWRSTNWANQASWNFRACSHSVSTAPLLYICRFQTDRSGADPMWVRFPALNSFLGLERRFDHQKKGLDVAEATIAMLCAANSSKQARNSEQRRTTSNRCSSADIDFREKFMKQKFLLSSKPTKRAIIQ